MEVSVASVPTHSPDSDSQFNIRCLLIDNNQLFCEATATLLAAQTHSSMYISQASSDWALEAIAPSLPDIILAGPNLEPQRSVDLVWDIKETFPAIGIIVLDFDPHEDCALELIEAGAADCLLQHETVEDLMKKIIGVSRGRSSCDGQIMAQVFSRLKQLSQLNGKRERERGGVEPTPREREILALLARALSNKEIAQTLGIAPSTVKNHVHNILAKLNVDSREAAVRWTSQAGLLSKKDLQSRRTT